MQSEPRKLLQKEINTKMMDKIKNETEEKTEIKHWKERKTEIKVGRRPECMENSTENNVMPS